MTEFEAKNRKGTELILVSLFGELNKYTKFNGFKFLILSCLFALCWPGASPHGMSVSRF